MIIKGDVNRDGKIDIYDQIIIQQYIFGSVQLDTNQKIAADANDDGNINSQDILRIARHRFGITVLNEVLNEVD